MMDDKKMNKLPPWHTGHTNAAGGPGGRPQGPPPHPSHPPPLRSLGSQEGVQAQQEVRPAGQERPPLSSLVPATRTGEPGANAMNRGPTMVTTNGAGPLKPPPAKRRRRWPRVVLTICLLLLLLGGGTAAYGYYYVNTRIQAPLAKIIHPVSRGGDEPNNNIAPDTGSIMGRSWNILLLGSDDDGKYNFPSVLTQVMMIVHVDTVNNSVYMVSIPRDSWVYVPGTGGMHKIDQAFEFGANQHGSFDDGVREARLTVEKDYGVTIDRYAWVGLSGFARVIDTLGGIDIDLAHPVVDDRYPDDTHTNHPNDLYALKRLYLAPGPQHLNGLQALEYVRSRHADLVGDIGRTQRQQQVLEALKKKLNVTSILTNLPQLIADLKGQVYTDLSEQEMIAFAYYGRGLPSSAIQRITLGPGSGSQHFGNYATIYDPTARANQDVIIPNCTTIQPVMNHIFGLGDTQSCNVAGPG
jgi:LCP family protein required for cell wall assembly